MGLGVPGLGFRLRVSGFRSLSLVSDCYVGIVIGSVNVGTSFRSRLFCISDRVLLLCVVSGFRYCSINITPVHTYLHTQWTIEQPITGL